MAATSILQVILDISGLTSGAKTLHHEFTNEAAPGQTTSLVLQSGFNSIAVPTTARGVVILRDPTSTVAVTFKGVTGDTGVVFDDCLALVFRSGAVPATIGLTAASTDTGKYTEITFF